MTTMPLLAIDYGSKKIGLAKSAGSTAVPFAIIENTKDVFARIRDICKEEGIEKIVVGMPRSLRGGPNEQSQIVDRFISALKKSVDEEVVTEDERMTSKMARGDDSLAAMHILQSYLDRIYYL